MSSCDTTLYFCTTIVLSFIILVSFVSSLCSLYHHCVLMCHEFVLHVPSPQPISLLCHIVSSLCPIVSSLWTTFLSLCPNESSQWPIVSLQCHLVTFLSHICHLLPYRVITMGHLYPSVLVWYHSFLLCNHSDLLCHSCAIPVTDCFTIVFYGDIPWVYCFITVSYCATCITVFY